MFENFVDDDDEDVDVNVDVDKCDDDDDRNEDGRRGNSENVAASRLNQPAFVHTMCTHPPLASPSQPNLE